ncbi:hypothetical protein Dimus_002195, partial [Dionaea muscipula]
LVKEKKHRAQISRLVRADGSEATAKTAIVEEILHFYQSMLGTKVDQKGQFDDASLAEGNLITDSQRANLTTEFSSEDVKTAL